MLASEAQGLALDFSDSAFFASLGLYGSAKVKDTGTPANNYDSEPGGLLSFSGTTKLTRQADGVYRFQPHNLFLSSAAPATQTITVVSGASYKVSITGAGQIVLSGAGSATVTAGSPATFTASTASLVCTVSGGPTTAHVRRTPCDDTYLVAGASAKYGLPYEWNASGVLQGIFVEPQATNLLLYSTTIGNAAWQKLNVSTASATGLDGASSATVVTPTGTSSFHFIAENALTVSGGTATHSVYAKANGYKKIALKEGTASGVYASFDLSSGTVLAATASAPSIVAVGAGWYRLTMRVDANTTQGFQINILASGYTTGDPNGSQFVGDGASGVYLWGAQLEPGSIATSPIITYGAQVTRAAEDIYLDASKLPSIAAEYSTITEVAFQLATSVSNSVPIATNASGIYGVGNGSLLRFSSSAVAEAGGNNSAVPKAIVPSLANAEIIRLAASFRDSDNRCSLTARGANVSTMTTLDWTGAHNRMQIGALSSSGVHSLNGYLRKVIVVPRYDEAWIVSKSA